MTKKMRFICLWGCPLGWFSLTTFMIFTLSCGVSLPSRGQLSYTSSRDSVYSRKNFFVKKDSILIEDWEIALIENYADEEDFNEEVAYEWQESKEQRKENPLNINSVTQEELEDLEILSPLAIRNFLLERHRRGGQFNSLSDLKLINGWDMQSIRRLLPYITINPLKKDFQEDWKNKGQGRILLGWAAARSRENIGSEAPLGAPHALRGKLLYKQKRAYSLGVMGASSLFEPLLQKDYPFFDRYSFHASFSLPRKNIQRIIVGDYRLALGEGLTVRQHFMNSLYTNRLFSGTQQGLKEALTNDEANSLRGLAMEIGGESLRSILFFSSKMRDANYDQEGNYGLVLGGLHRTEREWSYREALKEISYGGSLNYRKERWLIGLNAITSSWRDHTLRSLPRYSSATSTQPIKEWRNFSLNYRYHSSSGRFSSKGEIAWSSNYSWAGVGLWELKSFSGAQYRLVGRYLTPRYATLYGSSFSHFSAPGNEWGILLEGEVPRVGKWDSHFSIDYYSSLEPRLHKDQNTQGVRLELAGNYKLHTQVQLYTLMRYQKEKTSNYYLFWRGEMTFRPSPTEKYTLFVRHKKTLLRELDFPSKGWSVGAKVDLRTQKQRRYGFLFAWFQADDFDSRLWLPIHQIPWEYRSGIFWGKGIYADFFFQIPLFNIFTTEAKISYTSPPIAYNKGNMTRTGWEASLALQASF